MMQGESKATKSKPQRAYRSGKGPPVLKADNLRVWFTYIAERQRVFQKWLVNAPPPWTDDPIIAHGRVANNFRYLDRETVWLIANVIEPLKDRPADLIFNIVLFRTYLNWHKSMEFIGLQYVESFDPTVFEAQLREAYQKLGKLSNGAYCVGSFMLFREQDANVPDGVSVKPARVAAMLAGLAAQMHAVAQQLLAKCDSAFTFQTILGLRGVGKFLGWQSCLDLGETCTRPVAAVSLCCVLAPVVSA